MDLAPDHLAVIAENPQVRELRLQHSPATFPPAGDPDRNDDCVARVDEVPGFHPVVVECLERFLRGT
jgi:hypothetical protein